MMIFQWNCAGGLRSKLDMLVRDSKYKEMFNKVDIMYFRVETLAREHHQHPRLEVAGAPPKQTRRRGGLPVP